jgi:hypothetical protein
MFKYGQTVCAKLRTGREEKWGTFLGLEQFGSEWFVSIKEFDAGFGTDVFFNLRDILYIHAGDNKENLPDVPFESLIQMDPAEAAVLIAEWQDRDIDVVTPNNRNHWLKKMVEKQKEDKEKILAQENPQAARPQAEVKKSKSFIT